MDLRHRRPDDQGKCSGKWPGVSTPPQHQGGTHITPAQRRWRQAPEMRGREKGGCRHGSRLRGTAVGRSRAVGRRRGLELRRSRLWAVGVVRPAIAVPELLGLRSLSAVSLCVVVRAVVVQESMRSSPVPSDPHCKAASSDDLRFPTPMTSQTSYTKFLTDPPPTTTSRVELCGSRCPTGPVVSSGLVVGTVGLGAGRSKAQIVAFASSTPGNQSTS